MLIFLLDSKAYTLATGSFSVYFHFSEIRILWPPSHKWHHKQTKLMFQITKFTLIDRIYPIEYTYIRIEDILWPRQILRVVKVRAISWGKQPCSLLQMFRKCYTYAWRHKYMSQVLYIFGFSYKYRKFWKTVNTHELALQGFNCGIVWKPGSFVCTCVYKDFSTNGLFSLCRTNSF